MLEATVRVRIPNCWASRIAADGKSLRIVDRKLANGGAMESLVEVSRRGRDGGGEDDFEAQVLAQPTVTEFRAVARDEKRVLGVVRCEKCKSCRALMTSDLFLTNAVSRDGSIEWTVRFDHVRNLDTLLRKLRRNRVSVDLRRLAPVRGGSLLTRRQAQVLRLALDHGYFEFPKEVGIEDLANRLGVAKSTVAETLHRAERKVLRSYVDEHP